MFRRVIAAAFLGVACLSAQQVRFTPLSEELIAARLTAVRLNNADRAKALAGLFEEAGCTASHLQLQKVKGERVPNVICTLPGSGDGVVVVGAHLDKSARGEGVVDNWSGASLLPSLYQSIKDTARKNTFVFAGFSAEETGLVGSRHYVKSLGESGTARTRAMVNIDTVGMGPPKLWANRSDARLGQWILNVAHTLKVPLSGVNFGSGVDSDSHPFLEKKIPVVDVHSITQDNINILHTDKDNAKRIEAADYYQTYRLVAVYLAYLDDRLAAPSDPAQ